MSARFAKAHDTIEEECFKGVCTVCPDNCILWWGIFVWIILLIFSIVLYGLLWVKLVFPGASNDMLRNIVIHIINGLFTFQALLNLPHRTKGLQEFNSKKDDRATTAPTNEEEQTSLDLEQCDKLSSSDNQFNSESRPILSKPTEMSGIYADEEENEVKLSRTTEHIILQALLWNSLFQIINQVFRCYYYTFEASHAMPGELLVNLFWPLSFLAIIVAGVLQTHYKTKGETLRERSHTLNFTTFLETISKDQVRGTIVLSRKKTSLTSLSRSLPRVLHRSISTEERPLTKTLDSLKNHSVELPAGNYEDRSTSSIEFKTRL